MIFVVQELWTDGDTLFVSAPPEFERWFLAYLGPEGDYGLAGKMDHVQWINLEMLFGNAMDHVEFLQQVEDCHARIGKPTPHPFDASEPA